MLGLLAPAPSLGVPAANGIVPLIRTGAALAPRLVGPLAPAVPVLGRSGAGLALLASFAAGYAVGEWLWGLLNGRQNRQVIPGEGNVPVSQTAVPIVAVWTYYRSAVDIVRCSTGARTPGTPSSQTRTLSGTGTSVDLLLGAQSMQYLCGGANNTTYKEVGLRIKNGAANGPASVETVLTGTADGGANRWEPAQTYRGELVSITAGGKPVDFPTETDPNWRPQPLPEIKPAPPEVLPLPVRPAPEPEPLPETQPEWEPVKPAPPTIAPPVAPPVERPQAPPLTKPRPPSLPPVLDPPPIQTEPDGRPKPEPEPPPTTRPPGVETIPGGEVGGPGQSPRPDLEGIAAEVGRIEQKLLKVLENQQKAGGGDDLLKLLEELKKLLEGPFPGGSYELFPVCETDANGQPRPPMVAEWSAGTGANAEINRKLDALADLIQFHKELRQPVCNRAPIGEEVTVNFREDPETATGAAPLRKVLRYRDRTGASVATHAAHWEGFEWDAGPVIVSCVGPWGEVQVWASSRAEGQRVIRHALAAGGWNPDTDPAAEWLDTTAPAGRAGRSGRMLVAVDLQGLRVTKRRGSSGPPEQVLPE